MSADRPLTDAQERVLIALADADLTYHKLFRPVGTPVERHWYDVQYLSVRNDDRPREALVALGLLEVQVVDRPLSFSRKPRGVIEARITESGMALLNSMGD